LQVAEGKEDVSSAIQKVVTPSPLTKGAVELAGDRELSSGHQIYDPHAPWDVMYQQIGRYLLHDFGQIGRGAEASGLAGKSTSEQKHKFWWQQAGISFDKTRAEKVAGDIAASKFGTEAESPEDQKNRVERREILDQLRQGNRKPLDEAQAKHELTHRQVLSLQHRAKLDPLEDTIYNFTIEQTKRVLEAAKADKDEGEIKLLERVLAQKRMRARAYSWQSQGQPEAVGVQ
jgi:hypothetical protein